MMTCNLTGQPDIIKGKYVYEALETGVSGYALEQHYFTIGSVDVTEHVGLYLYIRWVW